MPDWHFHRHWGILVSNFQNHRASEENQSCNGISKPSPVQDWDAGMPMPMPSYAKQAAAIPQPESCFAVVALFLSIIAGWPMSFAIIWKLMHCKKMWRGNPASGVGWRGTELPGCPFLRPSAMWNFPDAGVGGIRSFSIHLTPVMEETLFVLAAAVQQILCAGKGFRCWWQADMIVSTLSNACSENI